MLKTKKQKLIVAASLLTLSAILLSTASFAWFAMNTKVSADDFKVEAYSDSLFLEISKTSSSTGFASTPVSYDSKTKDLRLTTYKVITASDAVYSALTVSQGTGNYDDATDDKTYYKRVDSDAVDATTSTGFNYVLATSELKYGSSLEDLYKNVSFVLQESGFGDGSTVYYERVGADYKKVTPGTTESVKGYYKLAATYTALTANDKFTANDNNVYWAVDNDGNYSKVAGLKPGTDLSNYYTVTPTTATGTEFDGSTTYYVLSGYDYVCIGTPAAEEPIIGYIYWGRAYSSSLTEVQKDNTLNVLSPTVADEGYYLHNQLWLRQGDNTNHANNLRVSSVKVTGANNSMNPALRVLFVATSSTDPSTVVTTLYDVGERKFYNDTNSDAQEEGALFAKLLGDEQEVITVDVYIYFDGTDDVATTSQLGTLNGQTVSIEFSIDELDYNKVNP